MNDAQVALQALILCGLIATIHFGGGVVLTLNHLARASVEMFARGAVTPIEKKRLGCACWLAVMASATLLLMLRPLRVAV
jgi:hypothetical protein